MYITTRHIKTDFSIVFFFPRVSKLGYIFYQNGKKYYMYESKVYKVEKVPVPPKSNYKDGKPVRTIDGLYEILYQVTMLLVLVTSTN